MIKEDTVNDDNATFKILIKGFLNRYNTKEITISIKVATYSPSMDAVEVSINKFIPVNILQAAQIMATKY